MRTITLLRKGINRNTALSSYALDLTITRGQGISTKLFIMQRVPKPSGTPEDVFVAVASANGLAEYDEDSPKAGSSYFRTNKVTVVSTHPDFLEDVFNNVLAELQQLVDETEVLDDLPEDGVYVITANDISATMAQEHTHYRIPLVALPAGVNVVYTGESEITPGDPAQLHTVGSQDTSLTGWLNTEAGDPPGYAFKYNIAVDPSLGPVWPIPSDKIQYAHIEANGVDASDVLVTAEGIYWKSALYGCVPWARTLIARGQPVDDVTHKVTLVFDVVI